jgi:hypothetical protein
MSGEYNNRTKEVMDGKERCRLQATGYELKIAGYRLEDARESSKQEKKLTILRKR